MEEKKGFEQLEDGSTLYDILGEEFIVTKEMENDFQLKKEFVQEYEACRQQGKTIYLGFKSCDNMAQGLPGALFALHDQILDGIVSRLVRLGVYDYSRSRLSHDSDYEEKFKIANTRMDSFYQAYEKVRGLPDSPELRKFKSKLYPSKDTAADVMDTFGLYSVAGYNIEKEILFERDLIEDYEFDESKADALRENCIRAGNINREQQRSILYQAFEADPINANVIETALILKLDDSGGLTEYAKRYGFYGGFLTRQKEVLERKYANRIKAIVSCKAVPDNKTFCELAASCAIMHDDGLDVSSYLKKLIDMRIAAGLSTEDVANLAYFLHTAEDSFGKETVDDTIQQFSNAQVQQELDSRTVNGVVYETHEQAADANAEVEKIRQLFSKRSETAGFSLLMEQNIVTEAGKKEYEIQEQKLMKNYLKGWRLPKSYIIIIIAVLVIALFFNPLITIFGAVVLVAAIFMSKKKRKEFEQVFRIEENHIVRR